MEYKLFLQAYQELLNSIKIHVSHANSLQYLDYPIRAEFFFVCKSNDNWCRSATCDLSKHNHLTTIDAIQDIIMSNQFFWLREVRANYNILKTFTRHDNQKYLLKKSLLAI